MSQLFGFAVCSVHKIKTPVFCCKFAGLKTFLHKSALLGLMLLYVFLVSFCTGDGLASSSNFTGEYSGPWAESYQSVSGKSLVTHTSLTENVVSVITIGKVPSFKYRFSDITTCIKYNNRVVSSQFLQQEYLYRDSCIGLPQTSIIFPFHYFW